MSSGKRKAPNSGETACVLCGRADVDPDICGRMFAKSGIRVHEFCLIFATGIYDERTPWEGISRLPLHAIRCTAEYANQKQCFVCGERRATISCAELGCLRSFHLPCAMDGECVTQFFGQHRSFCGEHRPRQASEGAPAQGIYCIICLEPVGDSISYHTMLCPVCKQARFHRGCIQRYAMSTGIMHFKCPICAEKTRFHLEMNTMGLQIPVRPLSWENNASALLQERHRHCDASECYYPGGREQAEEEGPWKLLLCSSCAAQGTHRHCSFLTSNIDIWECESCAGVGTASRSSLEAAHRRHPRPGGRGQPQNHFPIQESTSGSQSRPRRCCDSSSTPAPRAQGITRSSARAATSRTSGGSPHRRQSRQQRRVQTRSRSPIKDQISYSRSRTRRRGGSGCTSARGVQSSTYCSTRSVTSRSSRGSPLPEYRRRSRQRGQSRTRSHSPVGHWASNSQSRSRRGHRRSSRQQGPARARSRSRLQHRSQHPHSRSQRQ
ncbi:PHD finger protein 7-like [Meleagris gallopavo]|uniref:PHD finger protein 7 n=2 Tax=Meleagris gallopavo TaxID=9103 RepID=G1MYA4_MELGA|nr:PHD finger protein 7-like [Meleagris gallopavo]